MASHFPPPLNAGGGASRTAWSTATIIARTLSGQASRNSRPGTDSLGSTSRLRLKKWICHRIGSPLPAARTERLPFHTMIRLRRLHRLVRLIEWQRAHKPRRHAAAVIRRNGSTNYVEDAGHPSIAARKTGTGVLAAWDMARATCRNRRAPPLPARCEPAAHGAPCAAAQERDGGRTGYCPFFQRARYLPHRAIPVAVLSLLESFGSRAALHRLLEVRA